jgi:hypothetical protein
MSKESERELDLLLHSRPFVPPNDDLARRIITAAKSQQQQGHFTTLHWLNGLFDELFRYQPGYILTLLLMISVCLGFITAGADKEFRPDGVVKAHTQDFFYSIRSSYL